jgi:hypothetical protein
MRHIWEPDSRGAALCLFLSLLGCTSFEVIEPNVCGNKVLEAGEDCDTYPVKGKICRLPGEAGACHFDCRPKADGSIVPCPPDLGCTADGVCRTPDGTFEPGVKLAAGVSSWLSTADFDGDGRLDIISTEAANELSQARFRIHYFGANAALEETRTFPRVVTRPVTRKLVGDDAADDLIFSTDLIGMLPGRADREWVPASFSSYVLPGTHLRAVPVRADGVGDGIGLAIFSSLDEGPGVYVPELRDATLRRAAPLTRPFEELAAQPTAAELMTGRDSPCSEVMYAFLGDDSVHVLDLCQLGEKPPGDEVSWRGSALEYVVHLPEGKSISSAPLAADVDGDGHLDVVVGSEGDAYVAHGDGTTLETQASQLYLTDQENDSRFGVVAPLAVGDLTGDGAADFVLPAGIIASHESLIDGQVRYFTAHENASKPWTMAAAIDLNGNGLLDVIAGTEGEPGLSFLSGSNGLAPVYAHINTQGPVQSLAAGDFDGDRIADVAYMQSGPPNSHSDTLQVAFGTRDAVPQAGIPVAGLADVVQLGSADQAGVDNIFVISRDVVSGVTRSKFTLFDGNPDRLPFAPYSLVTFSVDGSLHDSPARVLAAGAFTKPLANDMFALGGDNDDARIWSMWIVPDIGGGGEPPRHLEPDAVPEDAFALTFNEEGGQMSAAALAADLEGDGFDEALLLMQKGLMGEGCYLLMYDIDGASSTASERGVVTFDEPCRSPELSSADLDADGALDLLALVGDPRVGPRKLRLLFNDGNGGFSLENSTLLSVPEHDIRSFSVFAPPPKNRASVTPRRIAFVTDDALYVAKNEPRARTFDSLTHLQDLNDAASVVVTDPTGDGVEDIAVADAAGLWFVAARLE